MAAQPDADVNALQALIDRGTAEAGPSLRSTFELPEHAISARQLLRYWGSGHQQVALATVNTRSQPRVAPVGALLRGITFYVPTAAHSARVRHVWRNPSVSLTHWISQRIAVIAHGRAQVIEVADPDFGAIDATWDGGEWWSRLRNDGAGVFLRIKPAHIYTWASDPASFAD